MVGVELDDKCALWTRSNYQSIHILIAYILWKTSFQTWFHNSTCQNNLAIVAHRCWVGKRWLWGADIMPNPHVLVLTTEWCWHDGCGKADKTCHIAWWLPNVIDPIMITWLEHSTSRVYKMHGGWLMFYDGIGVRLWHIAVKVDAPIHIYRVYTFPQLAGQTPSRVRLGSWIIELRVYIAPARGSDSPRF